MSGDKFADLIVVGAGVLGTFHAWHAVQEGRSVIHIDRDSRARGATVRNFGQVVPSGLDRHWQRFGRESLEIYKTIQAQFDISVRELGTVYIASDEEELTLIEELHGLNREHQFASELWTTDQCLNRYPQLKRDYCVGGLFYPQEVSVDPRKMIHRLHQFLLQQTGYHASFGNGVREVCEGGDGTVHVRLQDDQVFAARQAVICNGSDLQTLYPDLFRKSGLSSVKLQMLRLKPQPGISIPGNVLSGLSIRRYECFAACPSWKPIKSREPNDSFSNRWGIHILFKQESDGSIILGDSHEYASPSDVHQLDFEIRADINEYLIKEGRKIFDLPSWEIESAWFGIYCQTDDSSGVFTRTIGNHIHIVTGIGGKGMTSSAGFAKHFLKVIYDR